ncbi:hypothetical protein ZIOFF_063065 [Zingiber officinale]|uniref:Uncharacterized protein n=1 Tax=Zingiber officinale TaxID=94328 RepID=A0A8J5F1Q3_ZINOF|nr:hypothetical protein ZIOFF_063065 [Zingiber officinale]
MESSSRFRVMCSYDGPFLPYATSKDLCYRRGETRMVVINHHAPLADLSAKLSLLDGTSFSLKHLHHSSIQSLLQKTDPNSDPKVPCNPSYLVNGHPSLCDAVADYGYDTAMALSHPLMHYSQAAPQPATPRPYQTVSATAVIPEGAATIDSHTSKVT